MTREKQIKLLKYGLLALMAIFVLYLLIPKKNNISNVLPPPTVIVQKPVSQNVTEFLTQTGNTSAFNAVNLVARVEGYLDAITFIDGTLVKKGQDLFVIEPQTYFEKVQEAKASVAAQKAAFAFDKAEYARQKQMYKENATSLKNVEKWEAKLDESSAQVAKAQANEKIAEINYSYTQVKAPFDGRIGRHLVDVGNLVGHGEATELATIEQIDPIYVYFNLNELDLIKLRQAAKVHGFRPEDINKIPAFVGMQNEDNFPHKGKLDFANTGLNASTGTIQMRALLKNKEYALLPGLFVQVRIPITKPTLRLTVPDTAVQFDQIGAYLLTVDKDNKVELKRVVLGSVDRGVRVVTKGIESQDAIIVNGLQNAIPGNQVNPKLK